MTVATLEITASTSRGSFSSSNARALGVNRSANAMRRSGHTSNSNSRNGTVTSIGFARRPSVKARTTEMYRHADGRDVYVAYARSVTISSIVLSTSLRSAIHATDSTCSGWMAKSAATSALGQMSRVARSRNQNSRIVLTTCNARFVTWCQPGRRPKSEMSTMCDIQVSGCQFDA